MTVFFSYQQKSTRTRVIEIKSNPMVAKNNVFIDCLVERAAKIFSSQNRTNDYESNAKNANTRFTNNITEKRYSKKPILQNLKSQSKLITRNNLARIWFKSVIDNECCRCQVYKQNISVVKRFKTDIF